MYKNLSYLSNLSYFIFFDFLTNVMTTFFISYFSKEWNKLSRTTLTSTIKRAIAPSFVDGLVGAILLTVEISYPGKFTKLIHTTSFNGCVLFYMLLYFILTDCFIYMLHRFVFHNRFLYKTWHSLHHSYKNPVSWMTRIFEPIEAITTILGFFLPTILIPLPFYAFYLCLIVTQIWSVIQHTDHDFPQGWTIMMPPGQHRLHHYYGQVNYNFGLFFQFWDRLLGTYKYHVI